MVVISGTFPGGFFEKNQRWVNSVKELNKFRVKVFFDSSDDILILYLGRRLGDFQQLYVIACGQKFWFGAARRPGGGATVLFNGHRLLPAYITWSLEKGQSTAQLYEALGIANDLLFSE